MDESGLGRFIGEKDEVGFISFVSTDDEVFELAEIRYWLDKDQRLLMRNQDTEPDYDFSTHDYSDILAEDISELGFSYYDGLNWNDSWDSDSTVAGEGTGLGETWGLLPKAIKIKIKVEDRKGRESEDFEVVTRLRTS